MEHSPNFAFPTPKGHQIILSQLRLTQTYEGLLEGTEESLSKYIRRDMVDYVRKYSPQAQAIMVLDDGGAKLPCFQWIAEFWCSEAVHTSDSDYSSRLSVCWFTDDIPNTFKDALQAIINRVDYENNAEDYDIMP